MSVESLLTTLQRLSVSVDALAALGAELRLRHEGRDGDPRVRALLHDIVRALDPDLLDGIDAECATLPLALVQTVFRQAVDLLDNPERGPGWTHQDPGTLESQGQLSRFIVRAIKAMAARLPALDATLRQPGAFLDVGTGVARLAIEAARAWPDLRIVGIDPWGPALELARQNVSESGLAHRVELRSLAVEDLEVVAKFTVAWLPGPFISLAVADHALARVQRALAPGGWLIFGFNAPVLGAIENAVARLRVVRSGGHPWTVEDVKERLNAFNFREVESFSPGGPVVFVIGRRKST